MRQTQRQLLRMRGDALRLLRMRYLRVRVQRKFSIEE